MSIKAVVAIADHPRLVATLGTVAGLFSAENIARAKDIAQLGAALAAGLCSVCAFILVAPKVYDQLRAWWHAWRHPQSRLPLD